MNSSFRTRVLSVVRGIPRGRVATYGDVGAMAGKPRAHRAVGNILRALDDPSVPAHRVVAAGGLLGGFGRDPEAKARRLRAEGILVINGRLRGFAAARCQVNRRRAASV